MVLVESGLNEAGWLILIIQWLKLRWTDVFDRLQQSFPVVTANTIQHCEHHVVEPLPRARSSNKFRPGQLDQRFGQSVVMRVSDATRQWLDASLG